MEWKLDSRTPSTYDEIITNMSIQGQKLLLMLLLESIPGTLLNLASLRVLSLSAFLPLSATWAKHSSSLG